MIYDPEMRAYLHAAGWIEGRTDDVNRIRDEAHWDGMISHPNVPGRVFTLAVAAAIQQARDVKQYGEKTPAIVGVLANEVIVPGFAPPRMSLIDTLAAQGAVTYLEAWHNEVLLFMWCDEKHKVTAARKAVPEKAATKTEESTP